MTTRESAMTDLATHIRRLADQMDLVAGLMVEQAPDLYRGIYGLRAKALLGEASYYRAIADQTEKETPHDRETLARTRNDEDCSRIA